MSSWHTFKRLVTRLSSTYHGYGSHVPRRFTTVRMFFARTCSSNSWAESWAERKTRPGMIMWKLVPRKTSYASRIETTSKPTRQLDSTRRPHTERRARLSCDQGGGGGSVVAPFSAMLCLAPFERVNRVAEQGAIMPEVPKRS